MSAAAPIISVAGRRAMVSFGINRPGRFWGDRTLFGARAYLINVSLSHSFDARAITVIIGPLYLQLGWRVS